MKYHTVFMYHDVINDNIRESGFQNIGALQYKVKYKDFENQIKAIANNCDERGIEKSQILFTFDDGGVSSYKLIAPILEKYNFRGYFFITTSFIGKKNFLNKNQIIDLHKRGHVIGAHSHTHPRNISLLSLKEMESEWSKSVDILKEIINDNICAASIPCGYYSEETREILDKLNIKYIFTSNPTRKANIYKKKQYIIGRFTIKDGFDTQKILSLINCKLLMLYYELYWKIFDLLKYLLGNYYSKVREVLLKIKFNSN